MNGNGSASGNGNGNGGFPWVTITTGVGRCRGVVGLGLAMVAYLGVHSSLIITIIIMSHTIILLPNKQTYHKLVVYHFHISSL